MRRAGHIVNEMEFRMLRTAKSFSPSTRADTMKAFSPMCQLANPITTPGFASLSRIPV
jgi:hypothetical protein